MGAYYGEDNEDVEYEYYRSEPPLTLADVVIVVVLLLVCIMAVASIIYTVWVA